MNKLTKLESNIEFLISKIDHAIYYLRQKELNPYDIAPQQLYVLHVINALGSKATAYTIASDIDREVNVVNRLMLKLEKDGLIKRIKNKPKSKLLSVTLTEKGLKMIKISPKSKVINKRLSFLSSDEREQMENMLEKILINLKR
jgi:DNA-binding MarR family transcriptional regulator